MSGNSYYAIQSLFEILVCEIGAMVSEHSFFFFVYVWTRLQDHGLTELFVPL